MPDDVARQVMEARSMGHRAVTEGVNLRYVELLRQEVYKAADTLERVEAERQRLEDELARMREHMLQLAHEFDKERRGLSVAARLRDLASLDRAAITLVEGGK